MRTSAAGNRSRGSTGFAAVTRSAEHGFTLVELMVVVTMIALAAAVVVWVMPDPQGRVRDEAARFAARAQAAHDQAIVGAAPVSLWVTAGGYGFDRRASGRWLPLGERALRVERWQEGTRVRLGEGGRVRVVFDPTGLADRPLDLRLERRGATASVRIEADGKAHVGA
jgi:general secretion pathway protein H